MKYLLFSWCLVICSLSARTQEKAEKEFRLKLEEVPVAARQFIDQTNEASSFKWYKEIGLNTSSIEAKAKIDGKRYSVEFDSLGEIEDVEVEIEWESLRENIRSVICGKLSSDFTKFKLVKVQQQFTGDASALISVINSRKKETKGLTIKYEIVLEGKTESEITPYEYTFDAQGQFVKRLKIVSRNIDNLEY